MIKVKTEAGEREIQTEHEARRMIQATAYAHQIGADELKQMPEVVKVVEFFNLDLSTLKVMPNQITDEVNQGYANVYMFS